MTDPEGRRADGRTRWRVRYYVPGSQVYAGSRGGASGAVHLEPDVVDPMATRPLPAVLLTAVTGRRGTISRRQGRALCGRPAPWYGREPSAGELERERCARCAAMAERYGVAWPAAPAAATP